MFVVSRPSQIKEEPSSGGVRIVPQVPLRMYFEPPTEEISLEQFELFGLDRLTVFKHMEKQRALNKGSANDEWQKVLKQTGLERWDPLNDPIDKDKISHFVLRIAYCANDDLRRWFIQQEVALFRYRFEQLTQSGVDSFFHAHNIRFQEVTLDELDDQLSSRFVLAQAHDVTSSSSASRDQRIYKIPFEQALQLVGQRKVVLQRGWAYVPRSELVSIILSQYRQHLAKELALTFRNLQSMRRDARVQPIINSLGKQYSSSQYKPQSFAGTVTTDQFPALAKRSFPLCMENLYDHLIADSHLRHAGRMQFGLFIKGMSVELDDAMEFWRRSFAKKVPADKFQKNFAYNIRHMFGKEGKRTSYTPYGCSYIINHGPSASNEHHGCPFRHFDEGHLRAKLFAKRLHTEGIDEIIKLVRGNHYQIACQKYYSLTHGGVDNFKIGNHPNQYVAESLKHYQDESSGGGSKSASSSSAHSSSSHTPSSSQSFSQAASSSSSSAASASTSTDELTEDDLAAMADIPDE